MMSDVMEREAPTTEPTVTERSAEEMVFLALALLRYGGHLKALTWRRLAEMEAEVVRLAALSDLTSSRRHRRADDLSARVLDLAQAAYRDMRDELSAELVALARLVADFVVHQINDAIAPGTARKLARGGDEDVAKNLLIEGALLATWLSRQAGDVVFRLDRTFSAAASQSQGATEVLRVVHDAFDSARRNILPIIRTAVTAVLAATVERMVSVENERILKGYVHVSTLDARTTKHICLPRAGKRWLADGSPVGHSADFRRPPLHMGCRSHLALWFKPIDEMPAGAARKIREAGRQKEFRDRPVVEPDLEVWLRSRPVAEQRAVVGSAKWEAWRSGDLTVAGLLDQSARPLDLGQIRKLLGI